jgi:hypothetical protein
MSDAMILLGELDDPEISNSEDGIHAVYSTRM